MEKNNLKRFREEQLLSKAELSRRAGLSVMTIDRIERGHLSRLPTKRKILNALKLDMEKRGLVFPSLLR